MILEIPIVSATALDSSLGQSSTAGVQKARQALKQQFGPYDAVSLGRHGTAHLTNAALLTCLTTDRRWDRVRANVLCSAYREAGLESLVASKKYQAALDLTKKSLQQAAATTKGLGVAALVARTLSNLILGNALVREVATEMTRISTRVGERLPEESRLPGRVERFEGPEALVVIDTGEREELRRVDAHYLQSSGIVEPGDAFMLHELRWSPDATARVYVPAVTLPAVDAAAEKAELEAAETPLPRPVTE
jgi:hypothetical protein